MKILVTGVTGYIGGRLIPKLLDKGVKIRVLVRDPDRVKGRSWSSKVDIVTADLTDEKSLEYALDGIDAAYYLVHSMMAGKDFENIDRLAALNFSEAAKSKRVKHIIYLGGLLPKGKNFSKHLRSRAEVGQILSEKNPTTQFRAGPVIGSGSVSFEMLRYLTERLPIMVAPKWILNEIQTISVRDILSYLVESLNIQPAGVIEVGSDVLTFKEMMLEFAKIRGLKRIIIPLPILAPGLASRWVGLVTPIPNAIAVPIIKGIIQPLLADTTKARQIFPEIQPISYRESVELALHSLKEGKIQTRWSNALGAKNSAYSFQIREGMIQEVRTKNIRATPSNVFAVISRLGGQRGWLYWNWAWKIRGFLDRILGGPGLRRGRRHAEEIFVGETIDFWRIEAVEKDHLIRLRAEMKVPGSAWICWEVLSTANGAKLTQTALFAPKGLLGLIYWYVLYPIHALIFSGMIRAIARGSEAVLNKGNQEHTTNSN